MSLWPFKTKKPVPRPLSPEAEASRDLAIQIHRDVVRLGFDGAQDIVCPFAEKLFQKALVKATLTLGDCGQTTESPLYSKSNLTVSVAETFAAYRAYFVLSPSQEAAEAALLTMYIRLASIVPDDVAEPLKFDGLDSAMARMKFNQEQIGREEPTLRAVREVMQGPAVA